MDQALASALHQHNLQSTLRLSSLTVNVVRLFEEVAELPGEKVVVEDTVSKL